MIPLLPKQVRWLQSSDEAHARIRIKDPPRSGRPYVYPTSVLIRCYLLMLLVPRLRHHATLQRFLAGHRRVGRLLGLNQVPHRTTFSRRFKGLALPLRRRIWAMGLGFVQAGVVELHILLADGTLHRAAGPEWPHTYQKRGEIPGRLRGLDTLAGWGHSPYRKWVWGYRTHPVVALTAGLLPVPILADARPANAQDNTILEAQLPWLPEEATVLVLDSSYEDHTLLDLWQQRGADGILDRWMIVDPRHRTGQPADWRQQMQVWRQIEEVELYQLRGQLIEPFFGHWKAAFQLEQLPVRGRDAPVYLLLALYAYQLLIWMNWNEGRHLYAYQHLILGLE
jgi:hypothetical protein